MLRRPEYALPLVGGLLLLAAVIAGMGYVSHRSASSRLHALARAEVTATARHIETRLQAWLDDRVAEVEGVARAPTVLAALKRSTAEDPATIATALNAELAARTDATIDRIAMWAVVETTEGRVLAASHADLLGRNLAEAAQPVVVTSIQPATHSDVFQGPAFSIITPTPPRVGNLPAAVIGWIGLPALAQRVAAPQGTVAVDGLLTDAVGRYLIQPRWTSKPAVLQERASGEALRFCLLGGSGEADEANQIGVKALVVYRWMPEPGWCLLTRAEGHALAAPGRQLLKSITMFSGVAWLLGALLWWLLLHWAARRQQPRRAAAPPPQGPAPARSLADALAAQPATQAASEEQLNQARSEFLASVNHEIRTPMNGVLGPLALLLRSPLSDDQRELAELARTSADTLLRSIHDVVDGARLEAGELQLSLAAFDPRQVIGQLTEELATQAAIKHLQIELACSTELPHRVYGDAVRFRQVLGHLLDNAIRFCDSGRLKVDVRAYPGWPGQAMVYCRVTDGDPESDRLAQLGRQLIVADLSSSLRSGGSGLGLAVCKALARKMGGRTGADGKSGSEKGVWVELPLRLHGAAGDEADVQTTDDAGLAVERPGARVLLVEDNSTNQHVGALMLRSLGCHVEVCGNGQQALERIDAGDYDIVFMDCEMPVLDGLAATRAIRQRQDAKREIPIVAVTAQAMPGDRETCLAAGMNDYLSKPVLDTDFAAALRRWLPPQVGEDIVASRLPEHSEPAGPEAERGTPALDPVTVNRLRSLASATEPGLLEQIFSAFRHDSSELIDTMGQAIAAGDGEGLRAAAHLLKGASGTIGARGMVVLCEQLHQQGERNGWEHASSLLEQLRAHFVHVLVALDRAQEASDA